MHPAIALATLHGVDASQLQNEYPGGHVCAGQLDEEQRQVLIHLDIAVAEQEKLKNTAKEKNSTKEAAPLREEGLPEDNEGVLSSTKTTEPEEPYPYVLL